MKKTIILLATAAFALCSCADYLDVNPKGEVMDADLFTTDEGYEDALYGVYNEIASGTYLYNGMLIYMPESMSMNFTTSYYYYSSLALADWDTNGPVSVRKYFWTYAYQAINHLNNIIQHSEEDTAKSFEHYGLYRGEALALRALLHFELIRYFGVPFWATDAEKDETIPYVTVYGYTITPYSSLDEVYEYIIADLKEAEGLLVEDKTLVTTDRDNVPTDFTSGRICHLNYYGVQALLARVYWTMSDMENAAYYAQAVIDSGKFTFRSRSAFTQPDNGTLDLNETIFGLYNEDQDNMAKVFCVGSSGTTNSFYLASDWEDLYEDGSSTTGSDYRLSAWFDIDDDLILKMVSNIYYTGASSYTGDSILGLSVIRIPEMYYILAEYYLDTDNDLAIQYYDAVVTTRGLDSIAELDDPVLTYDMLYNERRKEFYGEGFTWHEQKRQAMDRTAEDGTVLAGNVTDYYTFPIPEDETDGRENFE